MRGGAVVYVEFTLHNGYATIVSKQSLSLKTRYHLSIGVLAWPLPGLNEGVKINSTYKTDKFGSPKTAILLWYPVEI